MLKVHIVGDILAQGRGSGTRPGYGTAKIVSSPKEADEVVEKDDILVVKDLDKGYINILDRVAGIISEKGGLTSHLAIECLTREIPIICNAGGATEILKTGTFITMDVIRGIVYNGRVNIM
ncbi:PEP-utilizing enzyme [Clostridium ljungdahlii]